MRVVDNNGLFPETEGFIIAIQDQVIATKNYKKYIMKDNSIQNVRCSICDGGYENIEHIISGCITLAPTEYLRRHNNVAKIVHNKLCHQVLQTPTTPYYKYQPEAVIDIPQYKIYWDRTIQTDGTVQQNRPDIIYQNKTTKCTYLIDIAVPAPANIRATISEKINKYLPLANDI